MERTINYSRWTSRLFLISFLGLSLRVDVKAVPPAVYAKVLADPATYSQVTAAALLADSGYQPQATYSPCDCTGIPNTTPVILGYQMITAAPFCVAGAQNDTVYTNPPGTYSLPLAVGNTNAACLGNNQPRGPNGVNFYTYCVPNGSFGPNQFLSAWWDTIFAYIPLDGSLSTFPVTSSQQADNTEWGNPSNEDISLEVAAAAQASGGQFVTGD